MAAEDPPREGPDVQPETLEGAGEWPRETGPADVAADDERAGDGDESAGEISRAEFIRRRPEEDPSQGSGAGPGAPETLEPTQGRSEGPGGAGMERPDPPPREAG